MEASLHQNEANRKNHFVQDEREHLCEVGGW